MLSHPASAALRLQIHTVAVLLMLCLSLACKSKSTLAEQSVSTHQVYNDALDIQDLGPSYTPDEARTPAALRSVGAPDRGGSTSIRRLRAEDLAFKRQGYFVRNRELGQVFTVPVDFPEGRRVDALVLRICNSKSAV